MKNVNEIAEKIFELQKLGANDEQIKELLNLTHSVSEILEKYEQDKDFITVEAIAERFEKEYGKADKDNYYYLKVLRLLKKGDIKGTKESNVKGWKVKHSDVEEYIKESKMSKEDWKNYAKKLEKKLAALQQDASQAPEQAENNGEKPEVLTQGEEQKEPKMPPSDALEFELNAMIARLQNENEDFTEIPSETITEVKEQILKDGGFKKNGKNKFKNPMNKRRLHETEEEAFVEACKMGNK